MGKHRIDGWRVSFEMNVFLNLSIVRILKMTIQQQIKADLKTAMKEKDTDRKEAIRVVMGEFGRMDKKELSDDEVIKILKKLAKSEREMLDLKGEKEDSRFIEVVESYLPKMASDDDIKAWISENIDFSQFNNKMQAMRPIMQHFGSAADGNRVKDILQSL